MAARRKKRKLRPSAKQVYVRLQKVTDAAMRRARDAGRASHEFLPSDFKKREAASREWVAAHKREAR